MFPSIDQILPSLQAFGVFGYWLIGLASALEAFFLTGVIVPGTLIVDAGGLLVQQGLMDFFDLAWFVALGSVLGSELSYWTGRLALQRIPGRARIEGSAVFRRAQALFERRGGLALVLGRFLGPVAGLVPLAAAMAIGLLMAAVGNSLWMLIAAAALIAAGGGFFHPMLIAHHVTLLPARPGWAVACFYFGFDAGLGIGAWILGAVLDLSGLTALYVVATVLTLATIAFIPTLVQQQEMG